MVRANFSAYGAYVTDSLHQWDVNRTLQVTGLNLGVKPEVHFSNSNMRAAIVRQATLDGDVVRAEIPNSLLQQPLRIEAHIGIYEGRTFKVVETVELPVIPRKRPEDYVFEDTDGEVYSFKALENAMANMVTHREAANITARIDAIVVSGAPTEGNTELIDVRTGADGTVHGSAGTAVRKQIQHISDIFANKVDADITLFFDIGKNKLNPDSPTAVYGGYFNKTNVLTADAKYNQSGYIPVTAGENYTAAHRYCFVLWYDKYRNYITYTDSYDFVNNGYVTAPANAAFARFLCYIEDWATMQVEEGSESTEFERYKATFKDGFMKRGAVSVADKVFVGYGDSIVYRNAWQPYVEAYYGIESVNLGIGSTTMAYVESVEAEYPCMVNASRVQAIKDADADILVIMGGTNDSHHKVSVGTSDEFAKALSEKDKTTFMGAYSYLIETLLTWKPTLRIILMTPMHSTFEWEYGYDYNPYAEAVREVANYYALPVADTAKKSGISRFDYTTYTTDGVHPNAEGGRNIANIVIDVINGMTHV